MNTIETERLVIRPVEQGDAEVINKFEFICSEFVKRSGDILKENLTGVYLHGSSVMGCFNPLKSDIDLIVVTEDEMSDDTKRKYMDMVMELNAQGPKKGIEMSVVRKKDCDPFVYPTPFDLHFSVAHIKWYTENPEDYIEKMKGTDADLAAHFTIIRKRGKCLYGLPIEQVFGEVPKEDYFDSIWNDIAEAKDDIKDNSMYIILNLARVLAYKREDRVLSKKEGGLWALDKLPEEYHPLIREALKEYETGTEGDYDMSCAESYAEYMLRQVKAKHVVVEPYSEAWVREFEKIRSELDDALGELALSIEHVGSTSVKGLSAKPIIDIDIVIRDASTFDGVKEALSKIGYRHEGDLGIPGREAFKYENKEHLMKHHLYVCTEDAAELRRHLSFRDYLRSHPDAVREYSRVKEEGAKLYPYDIDGYMAYKAPVIEKIYKEFNEENI